MVQDGFIVLGLRSVGSVERSIYIFVIPSLVYVTEHSKPYSANMFGRIHKITLPSSWHI